MHSFQLALFGGFKLHLDGLPVHEFTTSKVQALLAYLVIESKRPHHRTTLATLLWPNYSESAARTNLRQVLNHLRRVLGDRNVNAQDITQGRYLSTTRNTIEFRTQIPCVVDATQFSRLIGPEESAYRLPMNSDRIDELSRAAELYRGDFLSGFYIQDGELFEEWVGLRRTHYHRRALELLVHLATYHTVAGNLSQAQHFAQRQLELEPWNEEAHRQLMLILARGNQRSAALAQYEQCRLQLAKELNVAPSTETTQLYEQIRAGVWVDVGVNKADTAPAIVPVFNHDVLEREDTRSLLSPPASQIVLPASHQSQDWGEAPRVVQFYGREDDQALLQSWLLKERTQVVMVLGMGGIGKTALATQTARTVSDEFEFVFWRSLLNAPPLTAILRECLRFLSHQQLPSLPESSYEQINLLFDYLRAYRCLLVLDNLESILDAGISIQFRPDYEDYLYLIKRMGQSTHQSRLMLTSRERPQGMEILAENGWVKFLQLGGLESAAGQNLLEARGVMGNAQAEATLVQRYSGNPLALKLVARTIQEFFDGDIDAFLDDELPIFDDIRTVLKEQFARLTPLERELLIWMAIEREPVTWTKLAENLVNVPSRRESLEALRALQRRSLLEKTGQGFVLQNVVTEYITDYLIEHLYQEIVHAVSGEEKFDLFHRYALLQAQAMEYVRQSQVQLILAPVVRRLIATVGQGALLAQLQHVPHALRLRPPLSGGYAAGNLINLLLHLGAEMRGYDFSRLVIREANLRGASLPNVDFTESTFHNSHFTDTFEVVRVVATSPDGHRLAAGTNVGEIRLWQLNNGQLISSHQGHVSRVNALVFHPSGDLFASASSDRLVRLWDATDGHLLRTLEGHEDLVNALAFRADGQWLATVGNDQTLLWNLVDGGCQLLHKNAAGITARAVAFHPTLPLLAQSTNARIELWDLDSGTVIQTLHAHNALVTALAYSPDGVTLASSSVDGMIYLWHAPSDEPYALLQGHAEEVRCLAFSGDGQLLASGSADYTVRLWRVDLARTAFRDASHDSLVYTLHGHVKGVNSVAFVAQSETLVSSGDDYMLHFWNLRNGNLRHVWFGHTSWIRLAIFSPTGSLLASCGDDKFVRVWDVQIGELRHLFAAHHHWVWAMAFSPNGLWLASGGADHLLCIWNMQTGRIQHLLRQHQDTVRVLAFGPKGSLLATGCADHLVRLWEPASGRLVGTLQGHSGWIQTLCFSADGRWLATGGNDQRICLWQLDTEQGVNDRANLPEVGTLHLTLTGQEATVMCLVFHPDHALLASAGDAPTILIWEAENGQIRHTLRGHEGSVNGIAFSPDGRLLVSAGSDSTVRVWDVASGELRHTLRGHSAWVRAVAFSPDGTVVASGSADHTICLWDVQAGKLCQQLHGHDHWVWSLNFLSTQPNAANSGTDSRADGRTDSTTMLASGSVDGTVRLWDMPAGWCRAVLHSLGPYAGMKIGGAMGISDAQKVMLKQLGAVVL